MERLPLLHPADHLAKERLEHSLEESSLPAFLAALKNDPTLAGLALRKGWPLQAAPVLKATLSRRIPFEPRTFENIVRVLASQPDPSTYEDLVWHFSHATRGHLQIEKHLKTLPDFPIKKAAQESWRLQRAIPSFDLDPSHAYLAAKYGDKEALRTLLAVPYQKYSQLPLYLRWLLPTLTQPSQKIWTEEAFEQLVYNPEDQQYR